MYQIHVYQATVIDPAHLVYQRGRVQKALQYQCGEEGSKPEVDIQECAARKSGSNIRLDDQSSKCRCPLNLTLNRVDHERLNVLLELPWFRRSAAEGRRSHYTSGQVSWQGPNSRPYRPTSTCRWGRLIQSTDDSHQQIRYV